MLVNFGRDHPLALIRAVTWPWGTYPPFCQPVNVWAICKVCTPPTLYTPERPRTCLDNGITGCYGARDMDAYVSVLRAWRQSQGLSIRELELRTGINRGRLSFYERGLPVEPEDMAKIVAALGRKRS